MIGHADRLSMGSRVRVDGGKGQECLDYDEGDWQLAKWVGLCVLCVLCACVQDGLRWDIEGLPHLLLLRMSGGSSLLSRLFILH